MTISDQSLTDLNCFNHFIIFYIFLDAYLGSIVKLCNERRGREFAPPTAIDSKRIILKYILPLNEMVVDFHDALKSLSSGYASFDYEEYGYESAMLSKVCLE